MSKTETEVRVSWPENLPLEVVLPQFGRAGLRGAALAYEMTDTGWQTVARVMNPDDRAARLKDWEESVFQNEVRRVLKRLFKGGGEYKIVWFDASGLRDHGEPL